MAAMSLVKVGLAGGPSAAPAIDGASAPTVVTRAMAPRRFNVLIRHSFHAPDRSVDSDAHSSRAL